MQGDKAVDESTKPIPMRKRNRRKGQFVKMLVSRLCENCQIVFQPQCYKQRFCSQRCVQQSRETDRYIDPMGYVVIKRHGHPHASQAGWVREHTVVACEILGRPLQSQEVVHHKDGNRENNKSANLEVLPSIAHHLFLHRKRQSGRRKPGEANCEVSCACGCGTVILKYDNHGRPRRFVSGHNSGVT